ncbi:MAG: AsmA family protein, partial [Rhodospirillales bacterium]|nr:AsmA family protein [Rhodospirillales bacterium]
LEARARGSYDGSGEIAKLVLDVESGLLDIDRYLPAPSTEGPDAQQETKKSAEAKKPGDFLAALSEAPLDLTPVRRAEAEVNVAIGGIKAVGFEVGPTSFTTQLKGGVLAADISELQLYDGTVTGQVNLDGSGDVLGVETALAVDSVDVGALARAAIKGEPPVSGIASGSLTAKAQGASPRALAKTLAAKLTVDLGSIDVKDAPAGAISELRAKLDLPGLESPPSLEASVVYNNERMNLEASLDPPQQILSGGAFAAKVSLTAPLITAGYDGKVLQEPVPGLDGTFDLDVRSVSQLAAWLGRPLDPAQPDPGPLKVQARFSGDGAKVALKEATMKGEALDAKASGSYDGSGKIAKIVLDVESGLLDIDRYLPTPSAGAPNARPEPAAARRPEDILAALSEEPLDLSPLRQAEADVKVAIGGIKAAGFDVGRTSFTTQLKDGVLNAELGELQLYGGNVTGTAKLNAAGDALGVETALTVDSVDVGQLARAATKGEAPVAGIASGSLTAKAQGASPRALAETLAANLTVDLGGIDVKDAPAGAISELKARLDLPGLESPPNLEASAVYNKERVNLQVSLDPINKVLAGEAFAARVALASKLVNAGFDGKVLQDPVPGLDGAFDLDVPSVGKLAAWLGQPLDKAQPDPGPLTVKAVFAGDGAKVALKEATIKGEALDAKASGSYDGSGEIAKIVLDVESGLLDIDRYLPAPQKAAKAKDSAQQAAEQPAKPRPAGSNPFAALPDEPIDLSGLRKAEAEVKVAIAGIKAAGFELGRTAFDARLKDSVLNAELSELQLYGGRVAGTAKLDAAAEALGVETAL